jgi:hypothetical protein
MSCSKCVCERVYFHGSPNTDDLKSIWQGHIIAIRDGVATVQLYSWLTGETNGTASISVELILKNKWRLYTNESEWRSFGDNKILKGEHMGHFK